MNVLIIDTETLRETKDFSPYNNYVFDIGGVVYNTDSHQIEKKFRYIIEEIYNDEKLRENYYFGKERFKECYLDKEKKLEIIKFKNAIKNIDNIIDTYNIDNIAAFNIRFDDTSINDTSKKLKVKLNHFNSCNKVDIYHMACQAINHSEAYIAFCVENGKVSEKGNISANVEAIYSFLMGDTSYEEEHTALDDAIDEAVIYEWVLEQEKETGKKFKTAPYAACWRLVQPEKV